MTMRPFLAWEARGVGSLSDARISYRFKKPVAVHILAEPVGFGIARSESLFALTAHGLVSWDTRLFEFGIGAGWSGIDGTVRDSAFAIPQIMRIGAIDGLNVRVFNQFVLLRDEWEGGGTNVNVQIPISGTPERWWIEVGGGGGISGYGFFETGVRFLIWGGGDRNSFFLRAAAGYARLSGGENSSASRDSMPFSHHGPMVTFGFEWRPGASPDIGRNGAPNYGTSHRYGKRRP